MGTKNDPGQFDCYAAAKPDEPMFVLLGRDRHAPTLVRLWALLRSRTLEDDAKIEEALQCASAMDKYRVHQLGKPLHSNEDRGQIELILMAATKDMAEHPDGYDEVCDCDLCRSYD